MLQVEEDSRFNSGNSFVNPKTQHNELEDVAIKVHLGQMNFRHILVGKLKKIVGEQKCFFYSTSVDVY